MLLTSALNSLVIASRQLGYFRACVTVIGSTWFEVRGSVIWDVDCLVVFMMYLGFCFTIPYCSLVRCVRVSVYNKVTIDGVKLFMVKFSKA